MSDRTASSYDGTLETTADGGVIRFERHLAYPIREVWDAITNPTRLADWWLPVIVVLATLTMTLGNLVALTQDNVKRMLAYSSIAHTGFLLTGVLGLQGVGEVNKGQITSLQAVLFYLVTYGLATLGAFGCVAWLSQRGERLVDIEDLRGLGYRGPTCGRFHGTALGNAQSALIAHNQL